MSNRLVERAAVALERINSILEKCGGPGSGVPGPCPTDKPKPRSRLLPFLPIPSQDPKFSAKVRRHAAKVKARMALREIEKQYPPGNPKGHDTESKYKTFDGSWTRERQALHDAIVRDALGKATPVSNPVSYMMGGGTGSGKSSAQEKMGLPKNIVKIDSDEIKTKLPEYQAMLKQKNPQAAAYAHYESVEIAKKIMKEASNKSYNLLLDGTGNTAMHTVAKRIEIMKRGGRKLVANYVTCDVKTAIKRNLKRAAETGRLVPENMLRDNHRSVSQLVPELLKAGVFDSFKLYDTSSGKTIHVASAAGSKLAVHDPELWNSFLAKGKQYQQPLFKPKY